MVMWVNSAYWRLRPPAADVEYATEARVMYSARFPTYVQYHIESMPFLISPTLRSKEEEADALVESLGIYQCKRSKSSIVVQM